MIQNGTKLRGHYKIIQYLGGGGFADTYLAQDENLPGSPKFVVKQLKPKNPHPTVLKAARVLFQREAEALYRLKHNQIPRLFAYFEEKGEFYLVEDYIEGDDLSKIELSPGKRLSEAETIKLLHDILEILAFVHKQNLIHLDIKPQNIIRHRQNNELFLIDFGAVKEIQNLETNIQGQVQSSVVIGTPGYMPSEQATRQPRFSSDVYAVGMLGIQALTGIYPHQLQVDSNTLEVIWRNRVQVSPQLADILDKMVRYHFSQRYPTAVEASSAIASLKPQTQPGENTPISPPVKKWWLNYKTIGLFISAIVILFGLLKRFEQNQPNFTKYENSTDGITIQYPDNWSKLENSNIITNEIVEFSPQSSNSNVPEKLVITGENLSDPLSLAEYTKLSKQEIVQQNNNVKILSETDSTLAGKRAYKVVYTLSDQGNELKRMETWTLKNFKVYSITYEAQAGKYDQSLPTAEKMINTFQLDK